MNSPNTMIYTAPSSITATTIPYDIVNSNISNMTFATPQNNKFIVAGRDVGEFMSKIEERLLILVPDPVKLEKYKALQQAYERYKELEALLND